MLTINDLTSIAGLFMEGMTIGGLLSALPFMLGYTISFLVRLFKKG